MRNHRGGKSGAAAHIRTTSGEGGRRQCRYKCRGRSTWEQSPTRIGRVWRRVSKYRCPKPFPSPSISWRPVWHHLSSRVHVFTFSRFHFSMSCVPACLSVCLSVCLVCLSLALACPARCSYRPGGIWIEPPRCDHSPPTAAPTRQFQRVSEPNPPANARASSTKLG